MRTFSRKSKKAQPAVVDFDSIRDAPNATESSCDLTASQSGMDPAGQDSQQSINQPDMFDQLLADKPAAAVPNTPAVLEPSLSRGASLFAAMLPPSAPQPEPNDSPQPQPQPQPRTREQRPPPAQLHAQAARETSVPPAHRKRKEQPNSTAELKPQMAVRRLNSSGGVQRRPSGSCRPTNSSSQDRLSQQQLPASLADQRISAITLIEAQDSGESVRIMDDLLYALDGLHPRLPATTQQESAIAIAEATLTQRVRLALRSEGAIQDVLSAASKLHVDNDPILATALSALLLNFSRQSADQPVLATAAAMSLFSALLQATDEDVANAAPSGNAGAAERVMRVACDSRQLPQHQPRTPRSIVLETLAGALHMEYSQSSAITAQKAARDAGLLPKVARLAHQLLCDISRRDADSPDLDRLHWTLRNALWVLVYATFSSEKNEALVLSLAMPHATVGTDEQPFTQWLLQHVMAEFHACSAADRLMQGWVEAGLGILTNLTQQRDGCNQLIAAGGLEDVFQVAAASISARLAGDSGTGKLGSIEILNHGLGLLINLAEGDAGVRCRLAEMALEAGGASAAATSPASSSHPHQAAPPPDLVALLCSLMHLLKEQQDMPSGGRVSSPRGNELTVDHLELRAGDDTRELSMIEAYTALLLGFLVMDDAELRAQAIAALPGASLSRVISSIEDAVNFYGAIGGMREDHEANMRNLLAALQQQPIE